MTGVRQTLDRGATGFARVEPGVRLELLGVYAGAVGEEALENLRLGRASVPKTTPKSLGTSKPRGSFFIWRPRNRRTIYKQKSRKYLPAY